MTTNGYTRQSAGSIVTGATIQASHFNAEYNAVEAAFSASTGHNHDGTAGAGQQIPPIGLASLSSDGIVTRISTTAFAARTLTGTSNEITVTNGTGVSGNPTISLPSALTFTGKTVTGGTFSTPTITVRDNAFTLTDQTDTSKVAVFECSNITTATTRTYTLPDVSSTLLVASDIGTSVQAYDSDLAAIASIASNAFLVRLSTGSWAVRNMTGSGSITVTNGNGFSGAPTFEINTSWTGQTAITTLGTITTGTWSADTIALNKGGTGATTQAGAANAVLPSQTSNSGKFLKTDGSNASWDNVPATDPTQLAQVGEIKIYAGSTAPSGYLLCYGQAVSRSTYSALFAVIGTDYGAGDGSTTFNIPDIRGRVIAGQDDMGGTSANRLTGASGGVDGDVLGATGGAETHTLTEAQLASHTHTGTTGTESADHTHSGTTSSDGAHTHGIPSDAVGGSDVSFAARGQNSNDGNITTTSNGSHTHTMTTGGVSANHTHSFTSAATGSGAAHNNVQPTIILNYIIKT